MDRPRYRPSGRQSERQITVWPASAGGPMHQGCRPGAAGPERSSAEIWRDRPNGVPTTELRRSGLVWSEPAAHHGQPMPSTRWRPLLVALAAGALAPSPLPARGGPRRRVRRPSRPRPGPARRAGRRPPPAGWTTASRPGGRGDQAPDRPADRHLDQRHGRGRGGAVVPPLLERLLEQPQRPTWSKSKGQPARARRCEEGWGWQRVSSVSALRRRGPDGPLPDLPSARRRQRRRHARSFRSTGAARPDRSGGDGREVDGRMGGPGPARPASHGLQGRLPLPGALVPQARRLRGRARLELPPVPRQHGVLLQLRHYDVTLDLPA